MKILVIGNGRIDLRDGRYYCSRNTGFLLKSLQNNIDVTLSYAQFVAKSNDSNDHLTDFDLNANNIEIKMLNVFYNRLKYINYLAAIVKIILLIFQNDFIYIFWPGQQSKIVGLLCSFFKRRYGIYIRGDFKLSTPTKYIYSNAEFCLSVSDYFSNKVKHYCKTIFFEPPLIEIDKSDIYYNRRIISAPLNSFLFVGRIESAKGIHELIEAFVKLINLGYNFKLHLVGGGDLFSLLKSKIYLDSSVSNSIIFHGMISNKSDLLNLYKTCDAFILPSHTEGFPRVIYEAMGAKMPIYTTFVGGIPSLMINNVNCIQLPLKDKDGIFETILATYKSFELLNKIRDNSLVELEGILSKSYVDHPTLLYDLIKQSKNGS